MIVPTGTGASIGGFAGDATPYLNLLASVSDVLITHPNVANAAAFQKMPENALYVEGYALDQFMQGNWALQPVRKNRIGVVFDSKIEPDMLTLHLNTLNAAKAVYGLDIVGYVLTEEPVDTAVDLAPSGCSSGSLRNPGTVLSACAYLLEQGATAIALCTELPELSLDDEDDDDSDENTGLNGQSDSGKSPPTLTLPLEEGGDFESLKEEQFETSHSSPRDADEDEESDDSDEEDDETDYEADYRQGQGVDPIGGLEGILSHLVTSELGVPCAHAPVFSWQAALPITDEVLDPRVAAEFITSTFLPCVLTGLGRAPRPRPVGEARSGHFLTIADLSALVVPADALGGPPVLAALEHGIPVLAVGNNRTVLSVDADCFQDAPERRRRLIMRVRSYEEAAGTLQMLRLGLVDDIASVRNLAAPPPPEDEDDEEATPQTIAPAAPESPSH
jgi:hypothetical protein